MSHICKTWKYIDEGNAHVVLLMHNSDHVIRLIKEDGTITDMETVSNAIDFVNNIMVPLIFGANMYQQEIVRLSPEDLKELATQLVQIRPRHRQIKSAFSQYAIKALNLAVISPSHENYCIEIKPKEGFLSESLKQYSKCYYCLKQLLKLDEKQIDDISDYCPLDLFSGNKQRMKRAITNLLQNPQNNLKIFKNNKIIFNENSNFSDFNIFVANNIFASLNEFLDFVIEILLSDGKSDITLNESPKIFTEKKPENCIENTNLKANSFLYQLLMLQKLSGICKNNPSGTEDDLNYVTLLIRKIKEYDIDLTNLDDRNKFFTTIDQTYLALISAVVKDCSIMISFSEQPNELHYFPSIKIRSRNIFYRLSVTDLEPKSLKTLTKRKKTEKRLLEIFELSLKPLECGGDRIQPHSETRAKQLEAWQQLITEYLKVTKQSTIDIRESQNSPLFNNTSINRKLMPDALLVILEDMAKIGKAAPIDKSKNIWEIYWHPLDEWGNMIYNWASCNGLNNSVCTLFELREGDNTIDEEFHLLDMNILIKALKCLEVKGKCELMDFDDNKGVKFF